MWRAAELSLSQLCNGNNLHPIKVECWDWQKNGKHQFIGEFTFTVDEANKGKRDFPLVNPKRKTPGTIQLMSYTYIERPSFL